MPVLAFLAWVLGGGVLAYLVGDPGDPGDPERAIVAGSASVVWPAVLVVALCLRVADRRDGARRRRG